MKLRKFWAVGGVRAGGAPLNPPLQPVPNLEILDPPFTSTILPYILG